MTPLRIAVAIFLSIVILGLAFHAHRVAFTNDEGILLDAAERISQGSRPYVDFWAYMSPGSYWLQAGVFRAGGVSQFTGRVIVVADFALQCSLLFWLTAQLASLWTASAVLLTFLGFQIADPSFLTAQHHWDSSTLALAAVAIIASSSTKRRCFLSGMLLAAAGWCTPTAGLLGIAIAVWLFIDRERRKSAGVFIGGVALVSAISAGALALTGSLVPFVRQMFWLKNNYTVVNAMPYGSIIGGFPSLFEGVRGGVDLFTRLLVIACVALPAILPPIAVAVWAVALWRKKVPLEFRPLVQLLLFSTVALVLSLAPRQDMMHLAFVAALPYCLTGAAIGRWIPTRAGVTFATVMVVMAGVFGSNFFSTLKPTSPVSTPVGNLRIETSELPALQQLLATAHPGEGLFVYPYMPIYYFLTQTKNPTRFSFFSPAMGTKQDEITALAELQAHTPEWMLYLQLTREEFLRVCPRGVGLDWRNELIEDWIAKNFRPVPSTATLMGYRLLHHVTEPPPALSAAR